MEEQKCHSVTDGTLLWDLKESCQFPSGLITSSWSFSHQAVHLLSLLPFHRFFDVICFRCLLEDRLPACAVQSKYLAQSHHQPKTGVRQTRCIVRGILKSLKQDKNSHQNSTVVMSQCVLKAFYLLTCVAFGLPPLTRKVMNV